MPTDRVRSGDVEIFYRKFGAPGRTPVLIVHGLSFFSYDWIDAATGIACGREVVAIDMRGFGQSDWSASRNYKLETLSDDVITVLDAGDADVPADSPLRRRWEEFLMKTERGYVLRRDLHYRDNFNRALETGQSSPVPAFLWPMLAELTIPALLIRAAESDMFEAATLDKALSLNPRLKGVTLTGGHDLARDNPAGLIEAVSEFLAGTGL